MTDVALHRFEPRDAAWLVARHAELYARDEGFDASFPPLVAEILDGFVAGHDPARERGWIARTAGRRLGSIFCMREDDMTARLRLFLLVPEARGRGLGKRLIRTCMGFARDAGYRDMVLWTHASHRAACAIYAAHGWVCEDSRAVHDYGVDLVKQSWRVAL